MNKILVIENSPREAERFRTLLEKRGLSIEICPSGNEASALLETGINRYSAVLIVWDIPGSLSGFDLLIKCRQINPSLPVVVISSTLDASLATRAYALGARDFLEKPIEAERLQSCLQNLLKEQNNWSPLLAEIRKGVVGESPALMKTLGQIAKLIPHHKLRVLLIGESGTGKELLARSIHHLSSRRNQPWVAVNVGEIPSSLIETALFGHEKGSFTSATNRHQGFFEESNNGTLFLDEIGELDLSLQVKLLRVIQEKEFRRVGGTISLPFTARLVCATNKDLAINVNHGTFRRDLFHRIAEVIVHVPPLRERIGDVDLLLRHFLDLYKETRNLRFARETFTILRSYSFPGNIRELDNIVKSATVACEGEYILPQHLPLENMGTFLNLEQKVDDLNNTDPDRFTRKQIITDKQSLNNFFKELDTLLPDDWLTRPYRQSFQFYEKAFDRVYLSNLLKRYRHNITKAALAAGIDTKTLRKRWKDCGLPSFADAPEDNK